jgi:hypothetical protein
MKGYFLTPALDAPDMVHLDPDETTRCGGREWGTGDLEADSIITEPISAQKAYALLRSGTAIPCRRCLAVRKDVAQWVVDPKQAIETKAAEDEAVG